MGSPCGSIVLGTGIPTVLQGNIVAIILNAVRKLEQRDHDNLNGILRLHTTIQFKLIGVCRSSLFDIQINLVYLSIYSDEYGICWYELTITVILRAWPVIPPPQSPPPQGHWKAPASLHHDVLHEILHIFSVRTRTYFWIFSCTSTYRYVPTCTVMRLGHHCVEKSESNVA
jgi:hypothetical protein